MKLKRIADLDRMIVGLRQDLESNAPVDKIRRPYTMVSVAEFERKKRRLRKYEIELEELVRYELLNLIK